MKNNASAVVVFTLVFLLAVPSAVFSQVSSQEQESTSAVAAPGSENAVDEQTVPDSIPSQGQDARRDLSPRQLLAEGVASHTVERRQEALAALGTLGNRRWAVKLVLAALDDKEPSVRQSAARDLGQMRARSAIPKLREALDDEAAGVSFAAAKSLWDMGDRSGRDVFIQILNGDKSNSSGLVKDQLETAKKRFQDPRQLAIIGAKEAASALFGPAAWGITLVQEATKDRSASARAMSAAVLGHDAGKDALRELDDALWDKNWIVRAAAAQSLGGCKRPDQIQHLKGLLWDAKPAVRYMAAASIIRLSTSKTVVSSSNTTKSPAPASAQQVPPTSK
jgi:HEAT repeat protein